jgi:RsiW-degrading membrane proteinase PrsW (M82 family)
LVFAFGGLSGFLAGFVLQPSVERWLLPSLFHAECLDPLSAIKTSRKLFADQIVVPVPNSRAAALLFQVIYAGLIEESLKLLVVFSLVFWRRDFTKPIQGLVYGIVAALGFGISEAVYHEIDHLFLHPTNRGFNWFQPLLFWMHPALSCYWAAALGYAKSLSWKFGFPLVVLAVSVSVSLHGLANFLIDWGH